MFLSNFWIINPNLTQNGKYRIIRTAVIYWIPKNPNGNFKCRSKAGSNFIWLGLSEIRSSSAFLFSVDGSAIEPCAGTKDPVIFLLCLCGWILAKLPCERLILLSCHGLSVITWKVCIGYISLHLIGPIIFCGQYPFPLSCWYWWETELLSCPVIDSGNWPSYLSLVMSSRSSGSLNSSWR